MRTEGLGRGEENKALAQGGALSPPTKGLIVSCVEVSRIPFPLTFSIGRVSGEVGVAVKEVKGQLITSQLRVYEDTPSDWQRIRWLHGPQSPVFKQMLTATVIGQ